MNKSKMDDMAQETINFNSECKRSHLIRESEIVSLYNSCRNDNFDGFRKLFDRIGGHFFDKDGMTPLHVASSKGCLPIVQYLISNGESIEQLDKKYQETPLHKACEFGKFNIIRYLVDNGADINATNKFGLRPLNYIVRLGDNTMFKYMILKGATIDYVDKNGESLLHEACYNGHLDIVKYLSANGISPDLPNNDKKTPTQLAQQKEHTHIASFLRNEPYEEKPSKESDDDEDDCFGSESSDEAYQLDEWGDKRSTHAMSIDNESCCSGGGDD